MLRVEALKGKRPAFVFLTKRDKEKTICFGDEISITTFDGETITGHVHAVHEKNSEYKGTITLRRSPGATDLVDVDAERILDIQTRPNDGVQILFALTVFLVLMFLMSVINIK